MACGFRSPEDRRDGFEVEKSEDTFQEPSFSIQQADLIRLAGEMSVISIGTDTCVTTVNRQVPCTRAGLQIITRFTRWHAEYLSFSLHLFWNDEYLAACSWGISPSMMMTFCYFTRSITSAITIVSVSTCGINICRLRYAHHDLNMRPRARLIYSLGYEDHCHITSCRVSHRLMGLMVIDRPTFASHPMVFLSAYITKSLLLMDISPGSLWLGTLRCQNCSPSSVQPRNIWDIMFPGLMLI